MRWMPHMTAVRAAWGSVLRVLDAVLRMEGSCSPVQCQAVVKGIIFVQVLVLPALVEGDECPTLE